VEFLERNKTVVAFISFTLFCIISLSVQSSSFTLTFEGIGSALIMPFQKGYDGIQGGIRTIWAGFTDLSEVREELHKTRVKLQNYESISDDFSEIKRENERLRHLLEMKERLTFESVPASIISKDPDNWFRTLIINRGTSDGIKENMPVIAFRKGQKAVVGKIIEARGSISRIIPIISPDLNVGVKLQESRYPGLLYGYSSNTALCKVDYISRGAVIKKNDIVITSGQGGIFPPGLLVGRVIKSDILESSAYQRAVVVPFIDYHLVEEVFVIKRDPDGEILKLLGEQQ